MSSTRALPRRPFPGQSLGAAARGVTARGAAALAGAAVLALALTACGSPAASGSGGSNFVSGTGEIVAVKKGEREKAPVLSGKSVEGKPLSLADYKGKIIVLNIWGSWCTPCREEAPALAKVAGDTKARGVEFVGLNTRDLSPEASQQFEQEFHIPYPSLYDPYGKLMLKFPKGSLNPQAIPTTFIIDRDGRTAVRALKALSASELQGALDPLIAEK